MTLWGTIFWLVPDWGAYDDAAFHAFWDFPRCKNVHAREIRKDSGRFRFPFPILHAF